MKNTPLFIVLLCSIFVSSIHAQECHGYFPFEPDTKFEMTYYDKKRRVNTVTTTTIMDITETDGLIEAEVSSTVSDKKGEEVHTADYRIACKDDGYEIDITNMVNPILMKASYGMEIQVSGDALIFPKELSVGKDLNDASAKIEAYSGDIRLMNMTFDITNRKVEGKESVTTPAGTFDCYKLSYDFNTKVAFVKKKYHVVQWIAEGVGPVKEESYNKKGKLESSSELTKLEQP